MIDVIQIPAPAVILKGEWYGVVYMIYTEGMSEEEHDQEVDKVVTRFKSDYDNESHWSVSLREVKREKVVKEPRVEEFGTLVEFRVRDVY